MIIPGAQREKKAFEELTVHKKFRVFENIYSFLSLTQEHVWS